MTSWALIRILPLYSISFDGAKQFRKVFLVGLAFITETCGITLDLIVEAVSFQWSSPAYSTFFPNCSVAGKLIIVLHQTGPYYPLYSLQNMVIYADQKFSVVYFYSILLYYVYMCEKEYIFYYRLFSTFKILGFSSLVLQIPNTICHRIKTSFYFLIYIILWFLNLQ